MIAPASVPQVMIAESFHHIVVSPPSSGIRSLEAMNVTATEKIDVIQTSDVSGCSKLKLSAFLYFAEAMALLIQYESAEVMIISTRMTKIQTRSCVCTIGSRQARKGEGGREEGGGARGA